MQLSTLLLPTRCWRSNGLEGYSLTEVGSVWEVKVDHYAPLTFLATPVELLQPRARPLSILHPTRCRPFSRTLPKRYHVLL